MAFFNKKAFIQEGTLPYISYTSILEEEGEEKRRRREGKGKEKKKGGLSPGEYIQPTLASAGPQEAGLFQAVGPWALRLLPPYFLQLHPAIT